MMNSSLAWCVCACMYGRQRREFVLSLILKASIALDFIERHKQTAKHCKLSVIDFNASLIE